MILKEPIVPSSCGKKPNCVLQSGSTHRDKMSVKCSFTGNHLHTKHAPLPLLIRQEGHADNENTTLLLPFRQQMSGLLFRGLGQKRMQRGEGVGRGISCVFSGVFAAFNGPCLSPCCDNFKQNKIKSPFNEEPHTQFVFNQKITKIRACFQFN